MNLTYATFNQPQSTTLLALERSATVLTHNATCTNARNARALYGKSSGVWYAEFTIFPGKDANGMDATVDPGDVSIGIGNELTTDSECVGDSANSYGYRNDGKLRTNNADSATVTAAVVGDTIGMVVDLDNGTVLWRLNDKPLGSIALSGSHQWYIAVTVSNSTTAFGTKVLMNAGQNAFAYPPTVLTNLGWYDSIESFNALRLSDRPVLKDGARYRGLISAQQSSLTVTRELSFWPWGGGVGQGRASLRVDNATGYVDSMFSGDPRDAEVSVIDAETGEPLAAMLVDSAKATDDGSAQISLRDEMAETQVALQRRLMPPNIDPASALKPWPLVLGAVYSIEPPSFSSADQIYALNDGPLAAIGTVRDKGDPFDLSALDYTINPDGTITLNNGTAQGRVTTDMSSIGGDPPTPPDELLNGDGDFTSATNWTLGGPAGLRSSIAGGELTLGDEFPGDSHNIVSWAKHNSFILQGGRQYQIRLKVRKLLMKPHFGYLETDLPASLVVTWGNQGNTAPADYHYAWWTLYAKDQFSGDIEPGGGEVEFLVYASHPVNTPFWIALWGSSSTGGDKAIITDVKVYEIGLDVVEDDSLEPIKLEAFMREVLENRAGWSPSRWSASDAAAIDAETGYRGIGLYAAFDSNMQISDALNLAAQAYCASLWIDSDNVLRITRLIAPESVPELARDGSISMSDMLDDPSIAIDTAPNLSTQLGARKNWTQLTGSDLVTDGVPLPGGGNPANQTLGIQGDVQFSDDGWTWSLAPGAVANQLDPDLTAIAALTGNGYAKRTGVDTWALSATVPWSDITGEPTTLSGYGITDAATAAQGALADSAVQPADLATVATSGSASDLVTGEVPDARLPARLQDVAANVTDWDNATDSGFYWANSATNAPSGTGYLRVVAHSMLSNNYVSQRAWEYNATSDYYWQREAVNSVWGAWEKWVGLDAPADSKEYVRKNNAWAVASAGGGGVWGSITGTLANQTDLQNELAARPETTDSPTWTGDHAWELDANNRVYIRTNLNALDADSANGGAMYFGVGDGSAVEPTGAIECSWDASPVDPKMHIGVVRGGPKTYASFHWRNGTDGGFQLHWNTTRICQAYTVAWTMDVPLYAPTPAIGEDSTRVATTAWVKDQGYGSVGAPDTLTASTTNSSSASSHTHDVTGFLPLTGGTLTGTLTGTTIQASTVRDTSDKRLKERIQTLENGRDIVHALRAVRFVRKDTGQPEVGLVAQEVRDVLPQVVAEDEDGTLSVAYQRIVAPLIAAVQEQDAMIDALHRRLSRLENDR